MPNQKKQEIVSVLNEALKDHSSVVLMDYTGLTHQQLAEIREKVFEAGGLLHIVKNNLFVIALKDAKLPLPADKLMGPTAVLFVASDNPSPIKTVYEAGKQYEALPFKWGIWDNELIDTSKIEQLANLPSKTELLARLVGQLKSPQARLVFSLKGNLQKLVLALNEVKKQKESAGGES